ncbi:MAG TPA: DUF1553 domain-containing protein, partial [Isosphaeraceae bacterium]|nr:DUF1553 domain-containing protein [Isosphaeraceae bacterium]
MRRAYFDLTGLPPTPEEVDAYLADTHPDAYERLVDRLLDSPRYGEKWGRHWLDLVRFAETNSYERDNPKPNAWRYRDYVIQSFNDDKPYDRFVREQLAGDELPDGGADGLIATGYYRLGIWDDEPSDREQARYDGLDDLVATTGQVFLGMTIDCARCHDHKIDPIPQKDYYRLLSFFQNINHYRNGGPTDEAPIFSSEAERAKFETRLTAWTAKRASLQQQVAAIEAQAREAYEAKTASQVGVRDLENLAYRFYRDSWDVLPDFDSIKHENEGTLPRGLLDLGPRTRNTAVGFVFEGELVVPDDGLYTFWLDSDDGSRLVLNGQVATVYDGIHGVGHEQIVEVPLKAGRVPFRLDFFQRYGGIGLRLSWSGPGFTRRMLSVDDGNREAPLPLPSVAGNQTVDMASLLRHDDTDLLSSEVLATYRRLRRALRELERERPEAPRALCVTEAGPNAPDTFVLLRGNAHVPGDRVEPAFLEVLGGSPPEIPTPAPDSKTSGRRTVLADWIVSNDNPLTARVLVNRLWQHHFGRGIVRSPNNFGTQGDAPTHPELLDWLATELITQGWHLKPLHRIIMTSNAYRMSSEGRAEALEADPTNDLFWRFDMRRLTAEELRDSILAVSGELNLKMFGPGIYPKMPAAVLATQSQPGKGWGDSSPAERCRRSVYVHVKRSLLLPVLEGFDLPETDRSSPSRFSTTQPTQALALLNSEFIQEQARLLA